MHLIVPFASALAAGCASAMQGLALPQLGRLLARLQPGAPTGGDETSMTPPHERALADALGWQGTDGQLPFAARAAQADGIDTGTLAWGLMTPVHWAVGRDAVRLADPDGLGLDAVASRAFFDALRELFESDGVQVAWGAPLRWYAAHEELDGLRCASVDRVIGRNVDPWMPPDPRARRFRRLQNEVQMLLYPHRLNAGREAQGALALNSFWLSGCGRAQPAAGTAPTVDDRLRAPLLAGDWLAWAQAWQTLDADAIAALAERAEAGEAVTLTLCGERHAQRFDSAPRSAWKRLSARWSTPDVRPLLEAL